MNKALERPPYVKGPQAQYYPVIREPGWEWDWWVAQARTIIDGKFPNVGIQGRFKSYHKKFLEGPGDIKTYVVVDYQGWPTVRSTYYQGAIQQLAHWLQDESPKELNEGIKRWGC